MRAISLVAASALAVLCGACSGGSKGGSNGTSATPVAPSSTTPHITTDCVDPVQYHSASCPDRTSLTMAIRTSAVTGGADVPWSYTFAGLSIAGTGQKWTVVEGLSIGDYEIAGQMQGSAMIFQLSVMTAPGVSGTYKANSIVSLDGTTSQIGCQFINYVLPQNTKPPQPFRFRFTIVDGFTPAPCG
jgi:hypothetical protein